MFEERISHYKPNEVNIVSASIYDYIIHAKKGEKDLISQLHFFENIFKNISIKLPRKHSPTVRRMVEQFLTSMDNKFRNFLGEFAILNYILTSINLELRGIEDKLSNKKSADFTVFNKDVLKESYIEVLNINLNNKSYKLTADNVKSFLDHRINKKVEDKLSSIIDGISFKIQPIIWGSWDQLTPFLIYFENSVYDNVNSYEPFSYAVYTEGNGITHHVFKYISNLKNISISKT